MALFVGDASCPLSSDEVDRLILVDGTAGDPVREEAVKCNGRAFSREDHLRRYDVV
jgi:hypothetical protein